MAELQVTASDLRVHLKDYANLLAGEGGAVVMSRHGFPMAVLISYEEYLEYRRIRQKEPVAPPEHPSAYETPVLEQKVAELEPAEQQGSLDSRGVAWLDRARGELRARAYFAECDRKRESERQQARDANTGPPS